jgi:hypothetical protein
MFGGKFRRDYPFSQAEKAIKFYDSLLRLTGEIVSGRQPIEPKGGAAQSFSMNDLLPEIYPKYRKKFSDAQFNILTATASGELYNYFSGLTSDVGNFPLIYGGAHQLNMRGVGVNSTVEMSEGDNIYAIYLATVKRLVN